MGGGVIMEKELVLPVGQEHFAFAFDEDGFYIETLPKDNIVVVHTGTTTPASDLGKIGDIYIKTA